MLRGKTVILCFQDADGKGENSTEYPYDLRLNISQIAIELEYASRIRYKW